MTSNSLEHRATSASLITGLSAILTFVFQIVSVPICLKYWGGETYGNWIALYSAFLILRSLDGGFLAYVGNKLNYLYYQDANALRDHLSSAVPSLALIGSIQLLLATACLASDQTAILFGMPTGVVAGYEDRLGLLVLVASWVLTCSYIGLLHRLLIPEGMMNQAIWWGVPVQVGQFGVIMVAASLQFGMLQTSFLFAASQLLIYLTSAFYIKHQLPAYYPWCRSWEIKIGLKNLRESIMLTFSNIIQLGASNGVVILVAVLAGPAAVPLFTTVRTISNMWTTATTVLTTPLLPDVLRFHAHNNAQKLWALNQAYWVLVGSAVNCGILLSYPLLSQLYSFWTGDAVELDKVLLCLLLGSVVVTNVGALMSLHLHAINSLRFILITAAVRCLFVLGGGFIFYEQLGLASFGVGIFSGELITLFLTIYVFNKYELAKRGVKVDVKSFFPLSLGAGSVLTFLIGQGFNWFPAQWSWLMAATGIAVASVWGWLRLGHEMRTRLVVLVTSRLK